MKGERRIKREREVRDMGEGRVSVRTGELREGQCIEITLNNERLKICKTREGAGKGEITIEKVSE